MTAAARGGSSNCDGQILQKCVETLGHLSMSVDEVEYLVEEQEYRCVRSREYLAKRLGPWGRSAGSGTERGNALLACQLSRQINPWRLPAFRWIPGVTHEHAHPG